MVQTTSFDINNSSKLRSLAKKYERPAPPTDSSAPAPAPRTDIFERINIPDNSRHDNSLRAVIDVLPDTRFILLFIIFNVMKLYPAKEQEAHPLLTPASYVAYCLYLLYGFFLTNDYHGRPQASFYANNFLDSDARAALFEDLKNAYVPPFMLTIFHALSDTTDPRRPGFSYFPTFAASRFMLDYGRIMPPQLFIAAHNIAAEQDTSRPGINAMNTLMATILMHSGNQAGNQFYAGNFIGAATSEGTYRNWLYQAVLSLFSPVTGKTLLRRTNIEPINLVKFMFDPTQVTNTDATTSNMYTIFLNAHKKNVKSTQRFITEFSNIVKTTLNGTFQLGAVPDDQSGLSILTHAYSSFALPTWHYTTFTDTPAGHKSIDAETFATKIKFLQAAAAYTKGTDLKYPTDATTDRKSVV